MMNIGINGIYLEAARTGVARYVSNLLDYWTEMYPENRYFIYFAGKAPQDAYLLRDCVVKREMHAPALFRKWVLWENVYLAAGLARDKEIDVFFSPGYTLPLLHRGKKTVVSIFDIYYSVHPEWIPLRNRYTLGPLSRLSAKRSNVVLTASQFDKNDIVSYYAVPDDKVRVIPLAAEEKFYTAPDSHAVHNLREKYGIASQYLLCIGHIINRRLQDVVVRAFGLLQQKYPEVQLVLIGENKSCPRMDMAGLINELHLVDSVKWLNYIPEEELAVIYHGAAAFVYLSIYEGESIPLKEAMASGVPVITSPVLREVVEDAGIIVEKTQEARAVCQAMESALYDEQLRSTLVHKGLRRAREFSWERCAQETMAVLREL